MFRSRFRARDFFEPMRRWRTTVFIVVYALLVGALFLTNLRESVWMQEIENTALAWRFQQRGTTEPDPRITLLGVDTSTFSIQNEGRAMLDAADYEEAPILRYIRPEWPWDKRVWAHVLDKLAGAGARLVIFDFVFFSQSEGDLLFSETIEQYRDQTVLASYYEHQQDVEGNVSVVFFEPNDDVLPWPRDERDDYRDLIGFANVDADFDKGVRQVHYQDSTVLMNFLAKGKEPPVPPEEIESDILSMAAVAARKLDPEIQLPAREATSFINYAGPQGTYKMVSLEEILYPESWGRWSNRFQDGAVYKDKVVIVGPFAEAEFKDWHPTPFGNMAGPEIQANLLATLLRGDFIEPIPYPAQLLLTFFFAAFGLWVFVRYQHVLSKIIALLLVGAIFVVLSQVVFEAAHMLVPTSGFLFCFFIGGNFTLVYDFVLEQYDRLRIHGMFGTYVSPEVVDSMIESGEEPSLGGVEEHITCFFSDVQSFSSFSEVLTPVQLVDLMNEYLTAMTDILHEFGGTLDKYIGDAIVAMFGAPIRMQEHAYQACVAAAHMQRRQAELRAKWESEGEKWPDLCHRMRTRIGLNTGMATVGNMGSATRFNYTFMGDNVNLAARCESGAKSYGVYNMVTDATYHEALKHGDDLAFRYLDKIVVKGRTQPVSVYELVGLRDEMTQAHRDTLELWETALEHYLARRWDQAIAHFERALNYEPHHPQRCPGSPTTPSHVLLARCHHYKLDDPGEDWDGVFVMKSK